MHVLNIEIIIQPVQIWTIFLRIRRDYNLHLDNTVALRLFGQSFLN